MNVEIYPVLSITQNIKAKQAPFQS